jgi:hypothetical protein
LICTFLWTLSFLKISVASRRCWFSKILPVVSLPLTAVGQSCTHFFPLKIKRGRFSISAIQYPLMRNRKVRNA